VITLRAYGSKGIWSEPVTRTLTVKTEVSAPTLTITEPLKASVTVKENFYIRGTASDDEGVRSVQYRLDAGDWQDATGKEEFEVFIDISAFEGGSNHTVQVRAFDGDSYSQTQTVRFIVEKQSGGGGGQGPFDHLGLIAVGVIILILVVILVAIVIRWMRSEPS